MWPEADQARAPVGDFPPRWASAWGDDVYGLWAELVVGDVVQRLRWVEPGSFSMGSSAAERRQIDDKDVRKWADQSEGPQHSVTFRRGYWLADTPCTQALWLAVMGGENPSHFKDGDEAAQRPVEQVTWDDAVRFCETLHQRVPEALAELPTEAEWEYAARAATLTAYAWGDAPDPQHANTHDSAIRQTTPVKRYAANGWGLYDMHGNVWEWCADALRGYQDQPEVDPSGGTEGDRRVLRGGSWRRTAVGARSACRDHARRGDAWRGYGFRLALRSPSPAGGAGGR